MLLVAEAVVLYRKLRRTPAICHQRYWSVCGAARFEQFVDLLRPGRGRCLARNLTPRRLTRRCAAGRRAAGRCAAGRHAVGRYATGGYAAARAVGVVITGYSVAIGIQIVGVAGVVVEHGLRRFLGAEAGAVILVGLRHGRPARIDELIVSSTQGETGNEH